MKKPFSILMIALPVLSAAQKMELVSTTNENPWLNESKSITIKPDNTSPVVEIFADKPLQHIDGFGGCFNEMGWEALKLLPVAEQEKIFRAFFSPDEANFNYNRLPIGASDYALGFYSYNETKDDFEMKNFSVQRDENCLIPFVHRAQQYNPTMHFFASPWCPPAWMKVNEHYASTPDAEFNALNVNLKSVTGTTGFKMLDGHLKAYSLYFSKYLDAYAKRGINITDLHVQNEVKAEQIFPSCIWEAQDLALFISNYLGPRFDQEKRDVNIWFGTLNVGDINYMRTAMKNEKAAGYIKGFSLQWDGRDVVGQLHKDFPQKKLIQSENECGGGENNWKSAEHTWSLMKKYLKNGAEAYIYWNFILPTPGRSHWGWVQNSMVTINTNTKEVVYTPEFYLMKHLSHFVKKGAVMLGTEGNEDVMAFKNPNGQIVIVLANTSDKTQTFNLKIGEKHFGIKVKPNSFNTVLV
jgi:glucosylceramidase